MDSTLLSRRVTSDWIDYRERLITPNRLRSYLRLEQIHIFRLQESIQTFGHVLDYARRSFTHIFSFLSKLVRTTPTQNEMLGEESNLRILLYGLGLQNAYAAGHLKSQNEDATQEETPLTLHQIMNNIQERIQKDPEVAKLPHVKSIIQEFQAYKKEQTSFREMSPNISDDRAPLFFTAYKQRVEQITTAIRSKYIVLQEDEGQEAQDNLQKKTETELMNDALARVVLAQAQEISKVRSTLNLAIQEGRGFREDMLKLAEKRDILLSLVEEQENILVKMSGPENPGKFTRKLTVNIVSYLKSAEKTD